MGKMTDAERADRRARLAREVDEAAGRRVLLDFEQLCKAVTNAKRKLVDTIGNWPDRPYRRYRMDFDPLFEAIDALENFSQLGELPHKAPPVSFDKTLAEHSREGVAATIAEMDKP